MRFKIAGACLILLCGCVTAPQIIVNTAPKDVISKIYNLTEDECILQAFVREDPKYFEKEKIYNALLTFRKSAPKGSIHYFFWYMKKAYLHDKNDWWVKRVYKRTLANYRYYKKTNEKLLDAYINQEKRSAYEEIKQE